MYLEDHLVYRKKQLYDFERAFYYENLKSQRLGSVALLIIAFVSGVIWSVLSIFLEKEISKELGFHFPIQWFIIILFTLFFYEILAISFLTYCIRQRKKFPTFARYLNAFIEVSFLTTLLALLIKSVPNAIIIFHSPVIFIYFYFIILSILRLDFFLSVFVGFLAGLEHLLLFLYFVGINPTHDPSFFFLFSPLPMLDRSIILFLCGFLAGFVAVQLRKKVYSALENLLERNSLVATFGQYISPAVADKIITQKTEFAPELMHVCVMFLDIRNFTSFSENKTPQEVIEFLNNFFMPLVEIINEQHGFINKFLGDGFMAVFGAPIPDNQEILHAANAAFEIIKKIQERNEKNEIPFVEFGIGLHSGYVMTGNVGSKDRKEYTIVGDTVNLASRVEGLNKRFHSHLIVTEPVFNVIREEHPHIQMETVEIKGKKEPVKIYILT